MEVKPPVYLSTKEIEYSIYKPTSSLLLNLSLVLPDFRSYVNDMLVIVFFQKSKEDLCSLLTDENVIAEKDRLFENFYNFSNEIIEQILEKSEESISDIIDSATGQPINGSIGSSIFSVDDIHSLVKYPRMSVGNCNICLHPKWNSKSYPSVMVTTATIDTLNSIFERYEVKTF
eukprot:TRINITY_DN11894_c0_g1_i1.p1 TRINITY_DN11894_c0_g1~~TRINITY_DN11894_c0_g1_i1.p1  ORF type:complete len:182 (-),score=31.91 TRINITY_DN11894_c0_g1_i1:158-679(-)